MEQTLPNYLRLEHYFWGCLLMLFSFAGVYSASAQELLPVEEAINMDLTIRNRPNYTTIRDLVGVNGGTNWDGHADPNPVKGILFNARSFHLMEIDYRYQANPANYRIQPCLAGCDEAYTCYPASSCELPGPQSGKSSFAYYKARYCNNWAKNFPTVFAALETINPYYKNGCAESGFTVRPWPDKWYTAEEWGGDPLSIEANAQQYAEAFAATFCPRDPSRQCVVNVLEVGNEPWGIPGPEAYRAICRGVVAGMKNYYGSDQPSGWRMQLSTAAFQAHDPESARHDFIGDMIPQDLRPFFTYVNIHPYAFSIEERSLTAAPESTDGQFRFVEQLEQWRAEHMPHARLNLSEFGWNSRDNGPDFPGVGEATQAIYLIRSLLMASRYGADKAFIYSLFDRPEDDLFNSTGLISSQDQHWKKALYAVKRLMSLLGDKVFLKALAEDADPENGMYAYLFGDPDGKPTHLVAWLPDETNHEDSFPTGQSVRSLLFADPAIQPARAGYFRYLAWTDEFDDNISKKPIVSVDLNQPDQHYLHLSAVPVMIPLQQADVVIDAGGAVKPTGDSSCELLGFPNEIMGEEMNCRPYQAQPMVPAQTLAPGQSTLRYQWQYARDSAHLIWQDIEGAEGAIFAPGLISESRWFRRGLRPVDCPRFRYSNPILKELGQAEDCEREEGCSFSEIPGGFRMLGEDGQHRYLLSEEKAGWYEAKSSCGEIGGQLVQLDEEAEHARVLEQLKASGISTAFIGLSDLDLDGSFEWTDGSPAGFQHWASGHPYPQGRPGGVYLGAWSDGPWYLAHFWTEKNYICEQSCGLPGSRKAPFDRKEVKPQKVNVFPNPARNTLYLESEQLTFEQLTLLQPDGKVIETISCAPETTQASISLTDLAPGLYFLRIRTGENTWINKRIVKQGNN